MKHGKEQTVQVYKMFTKSGKPVYQWASMKSFNLEGPTNRPAQIVGEDPQSKLHQLRLQKAKEVIGEECEWKPAGTTRVMPLYI